MAAQKQRQLDVWTLFNSATANDELGLEIYLERVLRACCEYFDASGASLFLSDFPGTTFTLTHTYGTNSEIPMGTQFKSGMGIAGAVVEEQRSLLVGDPFDLPVLARKRVTRNPAIGSAMIVPLVSAEMGTIGVMNFSRKPEQVPFRRLDLKRADSIVHQVALAISNARLFVRTNMMMYEAKEFQTKLQTVIACVGFGLIVISEDKIVTECNAEAPVTLDTPVQVGDNFDLTLARLPISLRKPMRDAVMVALKGESYRCRATEPDGDRAWTITAKPMPIGGATLAIEELTEFEREQREVARIKRLAEIGQMTASIAHEIRNPLTGIKAAAQLVRSDPSHALEFADVVQEEVDKLNQLCDEFLEFARPMIIKVEPTSLSQVVERVTSRMASAFDQRKVGLITQLDSRNDEFPIDERRFEQILLNLLTNALQASSEGQVVTVRTNDSRLIISDEGSGMDQETLSKLFMPFFTTKAQGTGLGLSTVMKIVQAHGATLDVWSEPGGGTRFEIELRSRKAA